jgi:hypothetical protein
METTITNQQLASILSLHVFVSPDKLHHSIETLHIYQKWGTLHVMATDRYCAAWGQYDLHPDITDTSVESDPVRIDLKTAKEFFPVVKKLNPNGFAIITESGVTLENGMVIPLSTIATTYPNLAKLFESWEEQEDKRVDQLVVNVNYLAKLAKIVLPTMGKKNTVDQWQLNFGGVTAVKSWGAIRCMPNVADSGIVQVLVQPCLKVMPRN